MSVLDSKNRPLGNLEDNPTIWLAAIALLPMVIISLLGWQYSSHLDGIAPIDLTNFRAFRVMILDLVRTPGRLGDSWIPMQHALNVLNGEQAERLYDSLFFAQKVRFQYPPTSLLPLELLSMFGIRSVGNLNQFNFVVFCLNAVGVGVVAWLLFRSGSTRRNENCAPSTTCPDFDAAAIAVVATISGFLFYPLVRAQVLGQIQIWIDALFTLTIIFWLLDKRLLAGICIGLACAIKPQFALLFIWGLISRQAAFSIGILISIVPIVVISLVRYGLHNNLAYLEVLSFLSRHGESFFANNSINGILNGYFSPSDQHIWDSSNFTPYVSIVYIGTLVAAVTTTCLIVILPLLFRRANCVLGSFGAASICTVIGSPVAWEHHYGILVPIYLITLKAASAVANQQQRRLAFAALSVSWILVADLIPFTLLLAHTPFSFLQANFFLGALVLLLVLLTLPPHERQQSELRLEAA
jgi:alpha-1,2-mannosyltransferase